MMKNLFIIIIIILAFLLGISGYYMSEKKLNPLGFINQISTSEKQNSPSNKSTYSANQQVKTSNKWFSSAQSIPSGSIFVMPGAYKIYEDGIEIGVPQANPTKDTVFNSFNKVCTIISPNPISQSAIQKYDDWSATIQLNKSWTLNFMQGSPTSYIQGLETLKIDCNGSEITGLANGYHIKQSNSVNILIEAEDLISKNKDKQVTLSSKTKTYRISVLPNKEASIIELFLSQPWQNKRTSKVAWQVNKDQIQTIYNFNSVEGDTLTTIWPHHRLSKLSGKIKPIATYQTAIGNFDLIQTSSFTSTFQQQILPTQFEYVNNTEHRTQIITKLNQDIDRYLEEEPPSGVYFAGTWFGAYSTLIQLSDLYQLEDQKEKLLNKAEQLFIPRLKEFSYDQEKNMLVANNPEFGNENGNDHHFHYGYYIRTASIITQYRPSTLAEIEPTISLMIQDIANYDRSNLNYPFLRYFSIYEGHSWADGTGNSDDGNNQESTSEALNAWYSIYLWGQVTQDKNIESLGLWLFSQELAGTRSYWFADKNPFLDGYDHQLASIIWGGKRDFATWFSGHPMHIYGIQWLPITPASIYYIPQVENLSLHLQELNSLDPEILNHEWADLYLSILSFEKPTNTNLYLQNLKTTEGTKTLSIPYQIIYQNMQNKTL